MKPQDLHNFAEAVFIGPSLTAQTAADAIADKVDMLGALRAVIADLTTQADQIRTELEEAGLTTMDGQHYTATLSQCKGRTTTDWQTIAKRFKPSAQLVRAHTTTGKPSTRLTVTARQISH